MSDQPMPIVFMAREYAPLTPVDAEAILGAGGEYIFTCNYNKLTKDTHPKLIEKLTNKGMRAAQNGEDFAPVFVSQIRHLTLMVDLHGDQALLEDVIIPYIDSDYNNRMTVVYKVPFNISDKRTVTVPVSPSQSISAPAYIYIIHPVTSLSELYLPNSSIGGGATAFSDNLETADYAWMGLTKDDVEGRMRGMTPPFCGTEIHRLLGNILGPLITQYGAEPLMEFRRLRSVVEIRYGGKTIMDAVVLTHQEMYTKKLCAGCPNALLCMASGNQSVSKAGHGIAEVDIHENHLVQQTCVENYFRVLMSRVGLDGLMVSRELLMLQRKLDTGGGSLQGGYCTQHFINVVTGIYQNLTKPIEWIRSKIQADGLSWAPAKASYSGTIAYPIRSVVNPSSISYGSTSLQQAALNVRLMTPVRQTHLDYFPDRYDKRERKTELQPAVLPFGEVPLDKVVAAIVSRLQETLGAYNSNISAGHDGHGHTVEEAVKLVMAVLEPLLNTEEGKTYLEVDTAFTKETSYQGVYLAMLGIKNMVRNNPALHPLALKELQHVQVNSATKLSAAVCSAYGKIAEKRYGHAGKCPHAAQCRHGDTVAGNEGCALQGVSGNEWAALYGQSYGRRPLMPCVGPITDSLDMITDGPDIIYLKLLAKLPQLEDSLVALALHLDRIRMRDIQAGAALYNGVTQTISPGGFGENTDITRGTALRTIMLYITGGQVYPTVTAPTDEFQEDADVYYSTAESVAALAPYVPFEGIEKVQEEYMAVLDSQAKHREGKAGEYTKIDGGLWGQAHDTILWLPENALMSNSENHTVLKSCKPLFNLRSLDRYRRRVEDLSPQQLVTYEQLRLRVIPMLAPIVYPTMSINGGAYENGALQFISKMVLSPPKDAEPDDGIDGIDDTVEDNVCFRGLTQATLFQVSTFDAKGCMSENIATDIAVSHAARKAVVPIDNKMILAKDSKVRAYIETVSEEGKPLLIHTGKMRHKGASLAAHSKAGCISTYNTGTVLEEGIDMVLPSNKELVEALEDSSGTLQREIRRQLYRGDYELLLSHYWTVNGKQTSPLGISALVLGGNPIPSNDLVHDTWVK